MTAIPDTAESAESREFDAAFLHNYGDLDPIPVGARALCGAKSTCDGPGETEPEVTKCCPICLALTETE